MIDGARWAISEGIADPDRVAVVGWSFGGYVALLGAVRNSDLFQCTASIAGVSDLPKLLRNSRRFVGFETTREQLGRDNQKLKDDSPLRFAKQIDIPILLVHGSADMAVDISHSKAMARALKRARKPHQLLQLKDAGHSLVKPADRLAMLEHLEEFLANDCWPASSPRAAP